MTFWERFYNLCLENNTKPNPVAAKLNISTATVTRWKNGSYPNSLYLEKISEYFNVSTDYLLGKTDVKNEQTTPIEQSVSENHKKLILESSTLSDEEIQKALEYVAFLKSQQK